MIRDLDAAAAEAVGVIRSIRPTELHMLYPTDEPIPHDLQERWREFSMNAPPSSRFASARTTCWMR